MQDSKIQFINRYSGRIETEAVYGEGWLRWAYGNPLGRASVALVARRCWLSRVYGWRMRRARSRAKIAPFIKQYGIDASEFADPVDAFANFNDFFIRRLKPEARAPRGGAHAVVFPADGRHLGYQDFTQCDGVFIKGERFRIEDLIADVEAARVFRHGTVVISRLAPVDYHRYHFPLDCTPAAVRNIGGYLYSVSPVALRRNIHYLTANKRRITQLRNPHIGTCLMIEIGATNVGSMVDTHPSGEPAARGAEKGYFEFGGSCVVTLFPPESVRLDDDLLDATRRRLELYAHCGDQMGTMVAGHWARA